MKGAPKIGAPFCLKLLISHSFGNIQHKKRPKCRLFFVILRCRIYYIMAKADRVLFITQEIVPYVPATEMSMVGQRLPQVVQETGKEIRIFMPKWGNINERRNQLHEVIRLSGMNLIIDDTDHPLIIKVASIPSARLQVYFIDNDDYFQGRQQITDENGVECEDNDERAIFYSRGVLETVKKLRWCPEVVHCNGWLTALAPLYLKKSYNEEPSFMDCKVVYSLYNDKFQQPLNENFAEKLLLKGVDKKDLENLQAPYDYLQLSKLAIDYSDAIIQQVADVDPEVLEYAKQSGKPFLAFTSDEEMPKACSEFYATI